MTHQSMLLKQSCTASKRKAALNLLLVAFLLDCGSHPGPLAGNWALTLISSGSLKQVVAAVNLSQSGDTVSGSIASGLCRETTSVSGNLAGSSLALTFGTLTSTGSLTGMVNSNFTLMTGTYLVDGDWCAQTSGPGTWSAAFMSS